MNEHERDMHKALHRWMDNRKKEGYRVTVHRSPYPTGTITRAGVPDNWRAVVYLTQEHVRLHVLWWNPANKYWRRQ